MSIRLSGFSIEEMLLASTRCSRKFLTMMGK
jgi:hypothetical protein